MRWGLRGYAVAMNNLETVQALYAAFGAGDMERILAIMDPAIEWNQCAGFPITGTRVGPQAIFEGVFGPLKAAWEGFHASVDEWLDAGDTVVALGHYEGVNRATGKPMRAAFAHVYDLEGGRITRYRQVADSWVVREAMG
jgi:ketosteroid isomerase-like protein